MAKEPTFVTIGSPAEDIDVLLSYRIIELFSEGLYASPNKAIEELVANSFDAGAQSVFVLLSANLHDSDATIAVIDDGEGMDNEGFKQHWLIGVSNKRELAKLPKGRQQIGQFGIGKLATYVLSKRLSHVSRCQGKFYAASMDYTTIVTTINKGLQPTSPIRIVLRELTEAQAQEALKPWTETAAFKGSGMKLFGKNASPSWTASIMSSLKPKVHEIKAGTLDWVLRTALPLRPDFAIWLNGKKLVSSKQDKGLIKRWVLGNDVTALPKPAPKGIVAKEDVNVPKNSEIRFGLEVPLLGRVTGYAEAYKDLLTGNKSDVFGRSNGFFVYVRGRLINVDDGHFGIDPDELRHGTFGRFLLVVNFDALDEELRSSRESVQEGPRLEAARDTLRAIFNFVRPSIDKHDEEETPGAKLSRKIASSPASLSRQPIVDLARAVVRGKFQSRYLIVPKHKNDEDRNAFLEELQERVEDPAKFLSGLTIDYSSNSEAGIALYDTNTGVIRINAWHPFVATFHDEFSSKNSRQPLELVALAEVLAEAHLHGIGVKQEQVTEFLMLRDQLLRTLANESGRQSAFAVSIALKNARNNSDLFQDKVCEAFTSLGFEVIPIGGSNTPDGVATAVISGEIDGKPLKYAVSLDAKSKETDEKKVSNASVRVSTIARHRNEYNCQHALVVGRDFATTFGDKSALAREIDEDRTAWIAKGEPKTITLITIDALADLVKLRPIKQVGLRKMRELFTNCRLPEESTKWVADIAASKPKKQPYKEIVYTIESLQKKKDRMAVKYSVLLNELSHRNPPIEYDTEEPLIELCKGMMQMAPGAIFAGTSTVELDQSAANVMAAINAATKEYEEESQ